jgi:chromosome partitioning protein
MIITLGSIKGNQGKSTLAFMLSVIRSRRNRRRVLLVDADNQGNSASLTNLRLEQERPVNYTTIEALPGLALRQQIQQLTPNYDEIIIDCGCKDSENFRAALTVCNKLVVPVVPKILELWSVEELVPLIQEAKQVNKHLRALSFLNMAEGVGNDNNQAEQFLRQFEPTLMYLNKPLVRRKVWNDALATGNTVFEYRPKNTRAIAELRELFIAIYRQGK